MDYSNNTRKELIGFINNRGLKVPKMGTGTNNSVLKKDLVALLQNKDKNLKKKTYDKYNIQELKNELNKLNIFDVHGTGINGRILRKDLIEALKEKTFKREKSEEGVFLKNVQSDVLREMLYKMDIVDVVNFCNTNKMIRNIVCNEFFWKSYSINNKYDTLYRKDYETWKEFVIKEQKIDPYSLEFILKQFGKGKWDSDRVEEYISLNYNEIMFKGDLIEIIAYDERGRRTEDEEEKDDDDREEVIVGYEKRTYRIKPFLLVYDFEFQEIEVVDGEENTIEDSFIVYDSYWDDNLGT